MSPLKVDELARRARARRMGTLDEADRAISRLEAQMASLHARIIENRRTTDEGRKTDAK